MSKFPKVHLVNKLQSFLMILGVILLIVIVFNLFAPSLVKVGEGFVQEHSSEGFVEGAATLQEATKVAMEKAIGSETDTQKLKGFLTGSGAAQSLNVTNADTYFKGKSIQNYDSNNFKNDISAKARTLTAVQNKFISAPAPTPPPIAASAPTPKK